MHNSVLIRVLGVFSFLNVPLDVPFLAVVTFGNPDIALRECSFASAQRERSFLLFGQKKRTKEKPTFFLRSAEKRSCTLLLNARLGWVALEFCLLLQLSGLTCRV